MSNLAKTHIHNKIECTETVNQGEKFHIVTRGKKLWTIWRNNNLFITLNMKKLRQIHNA